MKKNCYFLFVLLFLSACQNADRTDLVFSEIAKSPKGNTSMDDLTLPPFPNQAVPVDQLRLNLLLGDRYYMLDKFMSLFEITPNQLAADHRQITLYDKIKPALLEFGFFGGGCDFYASTNAWSPILADQDLINNTTFSYKLSPGTHQEFWHESCWYFHGQYANYTGLPMLEWSQPVVSSPARFAASMRVCHLLTKNRIEVFLTNKMGFDVGNLPLLSETNLTRLMQQFHMAYSPKTDEIEALLRVKDLISSDPEAVLSNPQKLELWRTATQLVCQSPYWHYL